MNMYIDKKKKIKRAYEAFWPPLIIIWHFKIKNCEAICGGNYVC